jgi:mRNA-degrading endonuclease RelE of RelBE toxin-antitoxin system
MTYTVTWKPEAERRLATLWMNASDRSAVTKAANEIDRRLRFGPEREGESRDQGRRVVLESPLGVLIKVEPQDRIVYVLTVWRLKERPKAS